MYDTKKGHPSFFRILLALCIVLGAGLIILGVTLDRNVVEKIGTALAMPGGVVWILLLTLSIQLLSRKKLNHGGQPGAIAATPSCVFLPCGPNRLPLVG